MFLICICSVLIIGESDSEPGTAKAVKCFNIFNHDSWPENQEDLVDHGADDLGFLLDHFSTVLRRYLVNYNNNTVCVRTVDNMLI